MKKKYISILTVMLMSCIAVGCSNNEGSEKQLSQELTPEEILVVEIEEAANYFKESDKEISKLASIQNDEQMIAKLEEVINKLNEYTDFFLEKMNDEEYDQLLRDASMNLKTGFYGVTSVAYEPMLKVFKGESSEIVDNYKDVTFTALKYVAEAERLTRNFKNK